jgi:hypothetical protein
VDELTHEARRLTNIKEYVKFPMNTVNFKLNNKYNNSHYPKMVNLAFHSMALREYYEQKHNWTAKTIESLWWPDQYTFRPCPSYLMKINFESRS